jgi:hypothetical protein
MLFQGIDRVAVVVRDFGDAVDSLAALFGIEFDVVEDQIEQVRVAHARSKFGLEVVSPMSADAPIGAHLTQLLDERGEGVDVVVVRVDDLDAAVSSFQRLGVEPVGRMEHGSLKEAMYSPSQLFGMGLVLNEYKEPHPCYLEAKRFLQAEGPVATA